MTQQSNKNTEVLIREAARKIFLAKGLAGARMQDIANEAGINKAMLHYYFRSKEKLFSLIFEDELQAFFNNLEEIMNAPVSLVEKIKQIVERDIDTLTACPRLPLFLFNELTQEQPECSMISKHSRMQELVTQFRAEVELEIELGHIRAINPDQLFINMISMTVYPFIAKPVIKELFEYDDEGYGFFMQQRKQEISNFIICSLRPG